MVRPLSRRASTIPPVTVGVNAGTTITMSTFTGGQRLPLRILSSISIGHGASAVIYKAEMRLPKISTKKLVALKVFPPFLRAHEHEMLRRELTAASKISHDYVLPFIGTSKLGGRAILVTPFMRNGNMLQYLKAEPAVDRRRLVIQVAEAVDFLHSDAGLVHGDLKCENVLVSNKGNALVADFGLSTLVEKDDSSATTLTGLRLCNTLRFAAPEILLGHDPDKTATKSPSSLRPRSKTQKSDVYAFGMLVLEAFTEKPPWPQLRNEAVMLKVVTGVTHPRPGEEITQLGLTDAWWAVLLSCWTFQPHLRPNMRQICDRLKVGPPQADNTMGAVIPHNPGQLLEFSSSSRCFAVHKDAVLCVTYATNGSRVVSGCRDGSIRIQDATSTLTLVEVTAAHKNGVRALAISPDGKQIASCGNDPTIRRWDAQSGAQLGPPMRGHAYDVACIAYSPDGRCIVSGSYDTTVRLWDLSRGGQIGEPLGGHLLAVKSVAYSPNGALIASGSGDRTIRIWDAVTGEPNATLRGHYDRVSSVCFMADSTLVVSAAWDGTVRLWNVGTLQLVCTMHGYSHRLTSIAISPSAKYIASGSEEKTILIWDAETGKPVGLPLTGHVDSVTSVCFTDGTTLLSGSEDASLRMWDMTSRPPASACDSHLLLFTF